jgi:hypothetical protein
MLTAAAAELAASEHIDIERRAHPVAFRDVASRCEWRCLRRAPASIAMDGATRGRTKRVNYRLEDQRM